MKCDIFSTVGILNINGCETYKTNCGGFSTLIMILAVLGLTGYRCYQWYIG